MREYANTRRGASTMISVSRLPLPLALALGLAACAHHGEETDGSGTLAVTSVGWNPSNADVGQVAAVVEQDKSLVLFGSKGVVTLTGGSIVSADPSITTWRAAASLPSPDGASTWLVGVDGNGRLERVLPDRAPEDVSDQYGIGGAKVTALSATSGATATIAFLLEDGLAIDDGKNVTHYAAATPQALATSDRGVAFADGTGVRVFAKSSETDLVLADARLVAWTGGDLVFATSHQVYRLSSGQTTLVYDAGGRTIRQLARVARDRRRPRRGPGRRDRARKRPEPRPGRKARSVRLRRRLGAPGRPARPLQRRRRCGRADDGRDRLERDGAADLRLRLQQLPQPARLREELGEPRSVDLPRLERAPEHDLRPRRVPGRNRHRDAAADLGVCSDRRAARRDRDLGEALTTTPRGTRGAAHLQSSAQVPVTLQVYLSPSFSVTASLQVTAETSAKVWPSPASP
jgi:hypothetical protein